MFILRVYDGDGLESNSILGSSYNLIRKDSQEKEFNRFCASDPAAEKSGLKDSAFAIISYNDGCSWRFIYRKQHNYIMASDGKTFAHLIE